jgi:hypothetical protein
VKTSAFGNDSSKIERYLTFWDRSETTRPLVGFTRVGWFPLQEFRASQAWVHYRYLEPHMIDIQAVLDDHVEMVREGETIDDDLIRGASPMQVAVPFLPGILGSRLRILPENVMGEERHLTWDAALQINLDEENPWFQKYLELADALARWSGGRFPVSHSAEIGPSDMHALLRGHTQSILDLIDEPEKSAQLLWKLGEVLRSLTEKLWSRLPLFQGGYFDAQYSLWAPGPIIRMQEDATAVYSPVLYRALVQPIDRMLARNFECNFLHLHSTSIFLLDAFLEVKDITCFQVNNDALGPPVSKMVPHFKMIQDAGRSLLIRGSFSAAELGMLLGELDPRGLMLLIMVESEEQIGLARHIIGM